jgi:tetratricopeptide (TPR) repeat protein
LGDTPAAIGDFRTALEISPRMADAHLNLGLAYERSGAKADALGHFSLYLRYEPNGPWAEFARSKIRAARRQSQPNKVTPFRGAPR